MNVSLLTQKRKIMAIAVAGACGIPGVAIAQASTVQIYGNIRVEYGYTDIGEGFRRSDMFSAYDTYIGFKGEEKLGGGLSAWFQCESTADVTGQETFDNGFCARNSGLGFKGAFGNVWFGIWDTPMKITVGGRWRPLSRAGFYGNANLLNNGTGGNVSNGLLGNPIATTGAATNQANFSRRQMNAINYHTPVWAGFQVMTQYSNTQESTGLTAMAAPTSRPRLYSLGVTYSQASLYLGAAYEVHKNYSPAGQAFGFGPGQYRQGDDRGWAVVAAYTFPTAPLGSVRLGSFYGENKYEVADPVIAGANRNVKGQGWALYADWRIQGPHTLRAGYVQAFDVKGNGTVAVNNYQAPLTAAGLPIRDTGAKAYLIQYSHQFSKRTEINVGYAKLDNERNSRFTLQALGRNTCQGVPGGPTPAAGAASGAGPFCNRDQDAWVVGLLHRF